MRKKIVVYIKKLIRYALPHRVLIYLMRIKYLRSFRPEHLAILNQVKGGVVIDCGANIGVASALFIYKGASRVIAFEPDPVAFERLKLTSNSSVGRIHIFQAAVGTSDGNSKLYFTQKRKIDPLASTYGSSMCVENLGVTSEYVDIIVCDIAGIINKYAPIVLLKIDIEGHEVDVVPYLVKRKLLDKVQHVAVETHERKSPALKQRTIEMLNVVSNSEYSSKFTFDWP